MTIRAVAVVHIEHLIGEHAVVKVPAADWSHAAIRVPTHTIPFALAPGMMFLARVDLEAAPGDVEFDDWQLLEPHA